MQISNICLDLSNNLLDKVYKPQSTQAQRPDFTVNRRLKKIIGEVFHLTPLEFSSKYNDKKGQKTYNILNEVNGISNKMLEEILTAYPQINKVWLLTGEGEMLNSEEKKYEAHKDELIYEQLIEQLKKRISDKDELIKSLKEQIDLLKVHQKNNVPQEGNAMNADAAGFLDK